MKYTLDEKYPPKHTLTPSEETFLQGLAEYILFLDKSLFFQINDLQRHTRLVLSGKRVHDKFLDHEETERDELEREFAELTKMLDGFRDNLWDDKLPEENWDLLEIWEELWKRQNEKLKEMLDKPVKSEDSTPMGVYYNRGQDSKVVLFVDAIEEYAKHNPYDTMFLMGMVLFHEYFHSFHFHVGTDKGNPLKCIEEPMAEYGSLVMLDSVASSRSPIANDAEKALKYALDYVKSKQQRSGNTAGYGFGAYLYENHRKEASNLIAQYANISCLIDINTLK